MRKNYHPFFILMFIMTMLLFAAGSGNSGPPKSEVLAKKYGVSESEASACMAIFEDNVEPVLDWISKQSGFLGFFKKDCADLRKEIPDFGGEENLLYALQNEAANFPISSTASDLTLHTGMTVQEVFESQWGLNRVRVVNIVHDSILAEVHDSVDRREIL